jgi:hypothetical protein
MHNRTKNGPFDFLTEYRERGFRIAIDAANSRRQAALSTSAHVYEHMSNRGKAFDTREWSVAHIMEAFTHDENAKRREIRNVSGIEFDEYYFVYFKKITDPTQLYPEPKVIVRARQAANKRMLPVLEDIQPKEKSLNDLCHILAGYMVSNGLITTLYFIDQDEVQVRATRQLELSTTSLHTRNHQVVEPPKPTIALKPNFKKRDQM